MSPAASWALIGVSVCLVFSAFVGCAVAVDSLLRWFKRRVRPEMAVRSLRHELERYEKRKEVLR